METSIDFITNLFFSGVSNLAAYLAAHVLLCLLPAFYIAGAMTALIPKETITRFLGRNTPKIISYPAAAAAGFLLAVCSCTVIPLFAGIYKKGAGLGPAITFLFVAPAVNILALSYTGTVIGLDLAIARLVLSLVFGIGVGVIMALIFRVADEEHDQKTDKLFADQKSMRRASLVFLLVLAGLLIAGTFQIDLLNTPWFEIDLTWPEIHQFQAFLVQSIPFDPSRGEEGVTAQGVLLIALLMIIGLVSWKGLEKLHDGFTGWTWIATGLVGLTLLIASLGFTTYPGGAAIQLTGKFITVLIAILLIAWMLATQLEVEEIRGFLWETWRFVKQIFPLLIVGVFVVGVIRELIKPEWIQALAGENTVTGNLAGVIFGVFMYFPTLVEVPIAQMFLNLGMHRGPLLAYLIADPELSLQSILITATIIGRRKAWTYVAWVSLFSTIAGLLYGSWVDGTNIFLVGGYLLILILLLSGVIWFLTKQQERNKTGSN